MKKTTKAVTERRLNRQRRPEAMPTEEWQRALRRQFGRGQDFLLENVGDEPFFSDFSVSNPQSGRRYRVAIRGVHVGDNFCSCPDFATNDLGTCKHIEFALARLAAKRGGKAALKRGFQSSFSELFLDYSGRRRVRLRLGTDCYEAVRRRAVRLFSEADGWCLSPDRFAELPAFLDAVRRTRHELRAHDDALAFIAEQRDGEMRRRILQEAYPKGVRGPELNALLKIALYPYQIEGALFAATAGRALIGDEMGLGKTAQAIGAMELFARHFGAQRALIVCPTSLKHQWEREIARFCGRSVTVVGGLRAARQARYAQDGFCKITNYETLARDLDLIQAWAPDVVIVDEAQRIKNWNTIAARALKRIKTPYAVVLTGTPLENRLEELISIVQFVDQYRLGPTWRLLDKHQMRDDHGRVIGYRDLGQIGRTLAPIMLRRRKADVVMQLPERVDNTVFVEMTPQQARHHEENREIVARIVLRWRKTGFLSEKDQLRLTCSLQNMRMSCNSTYLLDRESDFGHKADELTLILEDLFEDPTRKVVVFSQWLRTHELIALRIQGRGWEHVLFHGGVPSERRGALVDRFLTDPKCRVFLSTDAGGVGLNLQHAAAVVVNMDMPWNPAVLEQRIGRVHRLGQTRGVQVINFVAKGTIEEGMLSVLAFKKSLFAGVLDGGLSEVMLHGTRLSKFMERVEQVTTATTAETIRADISVDSEPLDDLPIDESIIESQLPAVPWQRQLPSQYAAKSADLETGEELDARADLIGKAAPDVAGLASLLEVGAKFLGELAAASRGDSESGWIATDPASGQRYLKLPMPEPHAVQRIAELVNDLLRGGK